MTDLTKLAEKDSRAAVEAVIDRVGRDAMFDRARDYGWSAGSPLPIWVWFGIADEIERERSAIRAMENDNDRT